MYVCISFRVIKYPEFICLVVMRNNLFRSFVNSHCSFYFSCLITYKLLHLFGWKKYFRKRSQQMPNHVIIFCVINNFPWKFPLSLSSAHQWMGLPQKPKKYFLYWLQNVDKMSCEEFVINLYIFAVVVWWRWWWWWWLGLAFSLPSPAIS